MLKTLQHTFKNSILEETETLLPMLDDALEGWSNNDRLNVYRNNTFVSLKKVLSDTFPAVTALLSEEFMRYACHQFIKNHPPAQGALLFYGAEFSTFLGQFPPLKEHAYIPHLAKLEWALSEVYDAEDTPFLNLNLTEENLQNALTTALKLAPHAQLHKAPFPIYSLWEGSRNPEKLETINMETTEYVLVFRESETLNSMAMPLSEGFYAFLKTFEQIGTLEKATEAALKTEPAINLEHCITQTLNLNILTATKE